MKIENAEEAGMLLEEEIVNLLTKQGKKLTLAESCTGGRIANRITNISGSSSIFTHGYVTYANEAKHEMLGVPLDLLNEHGAVSEPVARAMAEGALKKSQANIAVAVTGIAGPTGETEGKPIGTVWISIATKDNTYASRYFYPQGRENFKQYVSEKALDLVRLELTKSDYPS